MFFDRFNRKSRAADSRPVPTPSRMKARALEPRYLFDAAAPAAIAEAAEAPNHQDTAQDNQQADVAALVEALTQDQTDSAGSQQDSASSSAELVAPPPAPAQEQIENVPGSIVFVDAKVENIDAILEGLSPSVQVRIIGADEDGVQVIGDTLASLGGEISGVHIFAHGAAGHLSLGNVDLSAESLQGDYAALVSGWGENLSSDADILIYGCSTAAGAQGQQLIDGLAWLTGADIAASTDATGAADKGGDWDLEYTTGAIETANPLDAAALASYDALLTTAPTVESTVPPGQNLSVDEGATLEITEISVTDPDSAELSVTLTVANGTITLANTSGLEDFSGNGSNSITLSGSAAAINAALNGMVYQAALGTGDPGTGANDDFSGADTITLDVTADGDTTSASFTVNVLPVNDAPVVDPVGATVGEGGQTGFSFSAVDPDNVEQQIIYKIESLPAHGTLTLNGNPVVVGTVFDQTQLANLIYTHDGSQVLSNAADSFGVSIEDGAGGIDGKVGGATTTSPIQINITITPVNQAPVVGGTTTVYEGETGHPVTITIDDPDQDGSTPHMIEIVSLPASGTLLFNGAPVTIGQQFSQADLANLTYDASADEPTPSTPITFDVKVIDDGGGTGTAAETTAAITLNVLYNNDDPELAANTGATVPANEHIVAIDTGMLEVTDVDSGTANLTYTVTAEPEHGFLQIFDGGAWKNLRAGAVFSQADIDAGNIRYFHTGGGAGGTDSFHFTVKDGGIRAWPTQREGGIYPDAVSTTLTDFTFVITIDPDSNTGAGGGFDFVDANTAPTGFTLDTVTLDEGATQVIDNTKLSVTDPDSSPSEIVYRLTGLSPNGTLYRNGVALGLYDSFTQADVDNGLISYEHNGSENFETTNNFIQFTVSDGKNVSAAQVLHFDVTPVNDAPTATVVGTPVVSEGGSILIDNGVIQLGDLDGTGDKVGIGYADPNDLTFTITTLPLHGTLWLDSDGNGSFETEVTLATVISKAQLDGGRLQYVHGGNEQFADSFQFQVDDNTDTNNTSPVYTVDIKSAPLNDSPFWVEPEQVDMEIAEGATGTIKGSDGTGTDFRLNYDDPDSTTIQVQYSITSAVQHGTLMLNGKVLGVGSSFTQDDLNNGRITYKHDGSENRLDVFQFTVRDGAGGSVDGQYTITITGAVNDAPTLEVPGTQTAADVEHVFSGANGNAITFDDIDEDDPDTYTDQYRVTLELKDGASAYANGTLTLGDGTGVTIISGTDGTSSTLVFEGSKSAIEAALEGLKITFAEDADRAITLSVTLNDLENGGDTPAGETPGDYNVVTKDILINASSTNDAPVLAGPTDVSVNEDATFNFTGANQISISDVDAFNGGDISVVLTVSEGILTLSDDSLITAGANDSSSITLTGSLTAINAALAGLSYKGNANYHGADQLLVQVDDGGNTGAGTGVDDIAVGITVNPVNDAPVIAGPSGTQVIDATGDISLVFSTANGNALAIDDANDIGDGSLPLSTTIYELTLNVDFGSLTVPPAALADLDSISGNGTGTIVLTGTKAEINAALEGLTFQPDDNNADLTVVLTATINDQGNGSADGSNPLTDSLTVNINVSGMNEAPVVTPPAAQSVNEDTDLVFSTANGNAITVADSDDFGADMTVTLAVGEGTLTLGSTTGLTSVTGNGTGSITIVGSEAELNAALEGLVYRGALDFTGSDTLTITINDHGNTGTDPGDTGGPDDEQDTETVAITVNPVNDAPVVTAPPTETAVEETAKVITGISFADVDDNGEDMTVTLAVGNGTLSLGGADTTGLTVTGLGTATLTLTGSKAELNAIIANLTYTGNTDFVGDDTLTVTLNDNGNTGSDPGTTGGPADEQDVATVAITVTPVNDTPVVTVPGAQTVAEEAELSITGISFADVDDNGEDMTVTLTVENGTLSLGGADTTGLTVTGLGTATLTLTGSKAELNAIIANLTYTGAEDYVGGDTLTVTLNDNGNTGTDPGATGGTSDEQDVATVAITITPVNDTPVVTVPGAQSAEEGTAHPITGISFADVDDNGEDMTVTLEVGNGTLSLGGADTTGLTVTGLGTATLTLTGSKAELNAIIANLTYTGAEDYVGGDTLTVTLNDNGNTGSDPGTTGGTSDEQDVATVAITVGPVNNTPVVTVPDDQTVAEETAKVITGISFADVDDNGADMTVTLEVGNGTLSLGGADTTGLTVTGLGTAILTLTGSKAELNAIIANLTYTGNTDFVGDDTLTVTLNDNGNTGSDPGTTGGPADEQDVATVAITVTPVNDTPVVTVPGGQIVAEEAALPITGISFADVDDNGADMTVTLSVGNGTLSLGGADTTGMAVTGLGKATLTLTGSKAELNAIIGNLTYTGARNFVGNDTLTVVLNDNGNTGGDPGLTGTGSNEIDSGTVAITVTPVNDTPVITLPGPQNVEPGASLPIRGISFADVDDNGADMTVTLSVVNGTLNLGNTTGLTSITGNGTGAITLVGSKAVLNSVIGSLVYSGNPGFLGGDALTVTLNDNGNTGTDPGLTGSASDEVDTKSVAITVAELPEEETPAPPISEPSPEPEPEPEPEPSPDPEPSPEPEPPPSRPLVPPAPSIGGDGDNRPIITYRSDQQIGGAPLLITDFVTSFYSLPLNPIQLTAELQDRVLGEEPIEEFSIPATAFQHTDPSEPIQKEARLPDGSPLPGFVRFNSQTGEFAVDTQAAKAQGVKAVDVKVIGRDNQGNEASAQFRIILEPETEQSTQEVPPVEQTGAVDGEQAGTQHAEFTSGKPSLNEQLRQVGRAGFEAQRDALVEALQTLAA